MSCGLRTDERTKIMKILLGHDWQDKPLIELIKEHPDLYRWPTLIELLTSHGALGGLPVDELIKHADQPRRRSAAQPLAIEAPRPQQSAEDWLKQFLDPSAPEDSVVKSNKTKKRRGDG